MRIDSSTTWVLSAALFSSAVADEPPYDKGPDFVFLGDYFCGQSIIGHQTSVFDFDELKNEGGHTFYWTQAPTVQVQVLQVDLMNSETHAIASWCSPGVDCIVTDGFSVLPNNTGGAITLYPKGVDALAGSLGAVLSFRLKWRFNTGSQSEGFNSSWSQAWAVAQGSSAISSVYTAYEAQMTAWGSPVQTPGPAPTTTTSAVSSGTTASGLANSTSEAASSGSKSGGLSTGAIVGIAVGCVGGVILISVVAGCLCFRRRRNGAGDDRGGSRGVQDIAAEKEAHASILDKDQPDTPYSEHNSQHPLNRGLGLAGRNESGVDLGGIGQAISRENRGSVHTESVHTVAGGNDRSSAVYSSLAGGAATPSHGTPVIGSRVAFAGGPAQVHTPPVSVHDRGSAVGSPVPRASSQLDRSLSPYRDGAGPAPQQEQHADDSATARSPSSLYSNPLDELQPISPESARDIDGAVGGGGGGGAGAGGDGVSSSQPPGNGRSNTPSGIAQQYAHLVEEGMTEDEIRRLEEEERALDAAIAERRR